MEKALDLGECVYDKDKADRWVAFFNDVLVLGDGHFKGQRFQLSWWQEFLWIRPVFGLVKADGTRYIRETDVLVGKKNGKTQTLAGINLGGLCMDDVEGVESFHAAGSEEQATIMHKACEQMVEVSRDLKARMRVYKGGVVEDLPTGNVLRVITNASDTADGQKVHFGTVDEVHVHKNDDMITTLRQGMSNQLEPLLIKISTFGRDMSVRTPVGRMYDRMKNVLEKKVHLRRYHCILFNTPKELASQYRDPKVWPLANPNYPISPTPDHMEMMIQASEYDAKTRNDFLQKQFNVEVQKDEALIDIESWKLCRHEFTLEDMIGRQSVAGIDMAFTDDLNAVVLTWLIEEFLYEKPFFFMPEKAMEKRPKDIRDSFEAWIADGFIATNPGREIDEDFIVEKLERIREIVPVRECRYDPNKATLLKKKLEGKGFTMVMIPQTYKNMSPATNLIRTLTNRGRIRQDGNPAMEWMIEKACYKQDSQKNIMFDKDKSSEKIDGPVGLAIGTTGWMSAIEELDLNQAYADGIEFL